MRILSDLIGTMANRFRIGSLRWKNDGAGSLQAQSADGTAMAGVEGAALSSRITPASHAVTLACLGAPLAAVVLGLPLAVGTLGQALVVSNAGTGQLGWASFDPAGTGAAAAGVVQGNLNTHAGLTSGAHGMSIYGASLVDDATAADARTTLGLGSGDSPTMTGLTLSGATASRLASFDGSKGLASVANLTSWVAGTTNEITSTSDGDGSLTLSLPAALTLTGKTLTGGTYAGAALNGTLGANTPSTIVATSLTVNTLTSGRVPYVTTGGLLTDSANFTWSGAELAAVNTVFRCQWDIDAQKISQFKNANAGTSARCDLVVSADAGAFNLSVFSAAHSGAPNSGWIYTSGANYAMVLGTVGTERIRIANTGAVSFAASAPLSILSTTASTSPSTGCATFGGGIGVAGRVSAATLLASGLTSGRVPYVTTGGLLTDSDALQFGSNAQVLGVRITPSTWGSTYAAIELRGSALGEYFAAGNIQASWFNNIYDSGTAVYKLKTADTGMLFRALSSNRTWEFLSCAAGSAGDTVTLTRFLAISNSAVTLGAAATSVSLQIPYTSGTTLVVASTQASTATTNGCATFGGGIGVAGAVNCTTAGVGVGSSADSILKIGGSLSTAASTYSVYNAPSITISTASVAYGFYNNPTGKVAVGGEVTGLYAAATANLADNNISNLTAISVAISASGANTITNLARGIVVNDINVSAAGTRGIDCYVLSGTNKWQIYVRGTAPSYFAGGVTFAASGVINMQDATDASAIGTAALILSGGASIAKSLVQSVDAYHYFGGPSVDGSWRMRPSAADGDMVFEKRVSGTWTEKGRIAA